jgi:diguanylate cyclase (GGDEF)-like protein/PAS domain S-box-containing protein
LSSDYIPLEPAPPESRREPTPGPQGRARHAGQTLLRLWIAGMLGMLLGYASMVLPALGPLSSGANGSTPLASSAVAALPAAMGLVLALRWGAGALVASAGGLAVALLSLKLPPVAVLAQSLAAAAMAGAACWRLRGDGFDSRLHRVRDVGALATACVLAAAVGALLGTLPLLAVGGSPTAWASAWPQATLRQGAAFATLAMPALALEYRLLRVLLPSFPWARHARRGLMALAALLLLWAAGSTRGPVLALALLLPPLLATLLTLRGSLVIGPALMLAAALLAAPLAAVDPVHGANPFAWPGAGWPRAVHLLWWASGVAAVLVAAATAARSRERARRWQWALDGSRLGVADWPLRGGTGQASSIWRSFDGHDNGPWAVESWLERTHPDDRAGLSGALRAVETGRVGRRSVELRLRRTEARATGVPVTGFDSRFAPPALDLPALDSRLSRFDADAWRWYEATLMAMERDPEGRPVRMLATLADVHARREAQDRERMSVALFQHLHEGLLVTDAELRVLDVNAAYLQILGTTREAVLGTVPAPLRPAATDPLARQQRAEMWATLREHGRWRGELVERRRNGNPCTLQATISAVRGPEGDLRYHVLVISDITEQQAQREQLERQAHFDELTRLPNRARLAQLMDEAMRAADRDSYLLVVGYLDLDRFKPVNDRFGHAAGDRLLAELAGRLRSALRSREGWADSAARLGGDEFVLLLRAGTMEEARFAVDRVLRVVAQPYAVDPEHEPVQVTASIGATVYPHDRSDADTLLRHADHAMYGAKLAGRNAVHFFDADERRRTEERALAVGRVQEALDRHEFVLFYQPKVQMQTGRVLGLEALLRWEDPERGLIAPLQFLPLIENTGLSVQVGDWVLAQAIEHLALWRREGLDISVSVNISARHLQERDFAQRLAELLARQSEPLAAHLELEMLETAAHADIAATSALLARCRAIGVRFALDDFGTGYSTLTYLKQLPVDVLKVDRSFVHHMLDDAHDRALVEGCIGLARTFGCDVIAEGVESAAQARMLLELGCTIGQGTGIAAPMRASQVAGWVREYRGMFALAPMPAAPAAAAPRSGEAPA